MHCGKNPCCTDIYVYTNVPLFYLQAHNTYRRNVRPRAANMRELVGLNPTGPALHVFFYIIDWFDNTVGYNNLI